MSGKIEWYQAIRSGKTIYDLGSCFITEDDELIFWSSQDSVTAQQQLSLKSIIKTSKTEISMETKEISMETKEILKQCIVEGNVVKLPSIQLDRNQYLDIKKHLELIGGKWKSGRIQGFIFEHDPTDLLEQISNVENRNLKKEFQFFETPDHIADWLVELAEIKDGDVILEPSAGRGAIVKSIHREFPAMDVFGYELMELNQSFLFKLDHFKLLGSDFLTECNTSFDVIIANPPFSKNQDINHVMEMYRHLKPGGRLVSIVSPHYEFASGKKEIAFREWLEEVEADVYPVDKGTFKESGTMIESRIIVVQN